MASRAKHEQAGGAAAVLRTSAAPTETPATPARAKSVGFPGLHGLRGGLAMWVVIHHAMPNIFAPLQLGHYGYLAVDVFFVMSGFILMHTHGGEFARLSLAGTLRFYELRYWRTFPAHFAAILVALAVSALMVGYTPPTADLIRAIALFDTWNLRSIEHEINAPIWSLRMEWIGYLAMPLLFFLVARLRSGTGLVLLALAVVLAQMAAMHFGGFESGAFRGAGALIRMAGGCTLGCLIWAARDHPALRLLRGDLAFAALLVAAWAAMQVSVLIAVPLLSLLTLASAYPGVWTARVLASRPALFLGRISFSLYIVHLPIMCGIIVLQNRGVISSSVGSVLAVVVGMSVAYAMCRLIEEPARRIGRRAPSLAALLAKG